MSSLAPVLVVDDERLSRQLLIRVLQRASYEVVAVESAELALEELGAPGACFSLVITDMLLPGMTGAKLGQHLAAQFPELPLVCISGLGAAQFPELQQVPAFLFLPKPFTPTQLTDAIARQLGV